MSEEKLNLIKVDEGFRGQPYRDTVGKLTVGYGRNLDENGLALEELGELFSQQPMSVEFAAYLLRRDVQAIEQDLARAIPWFNELDETRRYVLTNMGMMGVKKVLGFKRMLAAMELQDWDLAARELLNSKYARQVGARATRLAKLMRGEL